MRSIISLGSNKRVVPGESDRATSLISQYRVTPASSHSSDKLAAVSRIAIFSSLEILFTTFAIVALALDGIPLPPITLNHPTEAKAGVTIIAIIWHSIAVLSISSVITGAFSAEWCFSLKRPGTIVFGETDRVSTLQSGLWDRIGYLTRDKSSTTFKLALLASVACMGLGGLGPSSVTTQVGEVARNVQLQVRNMSLTSGTGPAFEQTLERAWGITRLESIENSTFGYSSEPGILAPWPARSGNFSYPTDAIRYQHECHWEAPTFISNSLVSVNGSEWSVWQDIQPNFYEGMNGALRGIN